MPRPVTLYSIQWSDMSFDTICAKAKSFGYDGLEIACIDEHFDVERALNDDSYVRSRHDILEQHGLKTWAISNHLWGQAVTDRIDERHKAILPARIWGDGKEDGVRERAAEGMKDTARAAALLGVDTVVGFTGSPIWHLVYPFPPNPPGFLEKGLAFVAEMWRPILDVFSAEGVRFALEIHPSEIAFDIPSAENTLDALDWHSAFGFNFDPSHFGYQGVDYVRFIRRFPERIYHVHMKDVYWSPHPTEAGVFGGHLDFGDPRRYWDFRSLGRGSIDFEEVIRALNDIGYDGPLSVEWEDERMDREHGAAESCAFTKRLDFAPSDISWAETLTSGSG